MITYDATDVPDIEILDSDNNKCWLSDQIDRDKIIFYLPNLGCASCYEQEILSIGQALCGASQVFPREKLEWAVRMVLEKEAKVESTAIKQMREEVKFLLDAN